MTEKRKIKKALKGHSEDFFIMITDRWNVKGVTWNIFVYPHARRSGVEPTKRQAIWAARKAVAEALGRYTG